MEPIRSIRNPAVVEAGRLHRVRERRKTGLTLIEGPHILAEALAANVAVGRVYALEDDPQLDEWPNVVLVAAEVMTKLAGTETPRGPVAILSIPTGSDIDRSVSALALWGVSDPGNVGTIIRSAAAFGLSVLIGPETADPWSPKVIRAAAGAHFRVGLKGVSSLEELGDRVAVTVVEGGASPGSLPAGPWTVLIGSEAHGLPGEIVASVSTRVTIPMPGGTESLNAGIAASIIAYELGGRDHH